MASVVLLSRFEVVAEMARLISGGGGPSARGDQVLKSGEVDIGLVGDTTGATMCCERDGPWLKLLSRW